MVFVERLRAMRELWRSSRARLLFDELTQAATVTMSEADDQALRQAISALSQSDPITKLLEQVRLGRMKPTDAGIRAVTEAWLGTYQKVLETSKLERGSVLKLDPAPRLEVLIGSGVLTADHVAFVSLRAAFKKALVNAQP